MSFEESGLIEPLLKALRAEGYTTPTPIQQQAIPIILNRRDLLGCAQTGTGKTAAFALPILQILHNDELYKKGPSGIKSLILTPTRELAIQIGESFSAYGRLLKIRHTTVFGGVSQHAQTVKLREGVDVLIATPGRLLDLMDQKFISLQHVKMFVLDEADRMLDMGFIHDVRKVISRLPVKRQTLFFSATMPREIQGLANSILTDPVKVEVTPVSSTVDKIRQSVFFVEKNEKKKLLLNLLKAEGVHSTLIFTRTKHGADRVAKDLGRAGVAALAIHGNKSQNARQNALNSFKSGKSSVLVATDIAARGIDVDNLSHVINFDLPNIPETYVHRIGRTGRAGASGVAFSFCDTEEREFLRDIQKLIGKTIPVQDHQYKTNSKEAQPQPGNRSQNNGAPRNDAHQPSARKRNNRKKWFRRRHAD